MFKLTENLLLILYQNHLNVDIPDGLLPAKYKGGFYQSDVDNEEPCKN